MQYIHALILGVLEGITEFLPISSTGHLALGGALLGIPQTSFMKSFEIIIQLGAILAVCALYAEKIISQKNLWKKIIVAFVPTALAGYFLYSFVVGRLLGNITVIAWTRCRYRTGRRTCRSCPSSNASCWHWRCGKRWCWRPGRWCRAARAAGPAGGRGAWGGPVECSTELDVAGRTQRQQ
jgi:hypothetical protein